MKEDWFWILVAVVCIFLGVFMFWVLALHHKEPIAIFVLSFFGGGSSLVGIGATVYLASRCCCPRKESSPYWGE